MRIQPFNVEGKVDQSNHSTTMAGTGPRPPLQPSFESEGVLSGRVAPRQGPNRPGV